MVSINLIPETVRFTQARCRRIARWLAALLVTGAALGVALGFDWLRRAEASELRAQSDRLQAGLEKDRAALRTITAEVDQLRVQIERAKALQAKRAWSGMIALIGSSMPEGCWLTSIATDPAEPRPKARATPRTPRKTSEQQHAITIDAPRKLSIIGYAPEAVQPHAFVSTLKEARVFSDVALVRSQRKAILDGSFYRYEIVCEW